tara:strand:+ start:3561 stop:4340 length:780 start_codon:yes stop_codon:yes gene_type:complete
MSYLDALQKKSKGGVAYQDGSSKGSVTTDIGKSKYTSEQSQKFQKMFDNLSPIEQKKLKGMVAKKKAAMKGGEFGTAVKNQDINNDNQEKLQSVLDYRIQSREAKAQEKQFAAKEKVSTARDNLVLNQQLALEKAKRKAVESAEKAKTTKAVAKQTEKDKIAVDPDKFKLNEDLFEEEMRAWEIEARKEIIGENDTQGEKNLEQARAAKYNKHRLNQDYQLRDMIKKLYRKYEDMDKVREYFRENGLEGQLEALNSGTP